VIYSITKKHRRINKMKALFGRKVLNLQELKELTRGAKKDGLILIRF
jgi:hypothetical protein